MKAIDPRRACARVGVLAAALVATACGDAADDPTAPAVPPSAAAPALASATLSTAFKQVSAGGDFNCGVTTDGRAYCWGGNSNGELGDGTREWRNVPTAVAGGLVFRNIAAGSFHTCGVTTDDLLYCWGSNLFGRLGDGTTVDRLVPTRVRGQRFYAIASIGYFHTCALAKSDHRAFCWGYNGNGQLGDGTKTERHAPVAVAGGRSFKQLDAGDVHTCAVTSANQAFCWGSDFGGKLGDGGTTPQDRTSPSLVAGKHAFIQISAGAQNTCAVNTAQLAFCWGEGPTGDGSLHRWFVPVRVAGGLEFRQVLAGHAMCGLSTVGKAYCWGSGGQELGDGNPDSHNDLSPVAVVGGHTFAQVSVADGACGRTRDGVIWCWGYGGSGALGNGSNASSAVPVRVNDPQG
jgi:alpha-tubulin suppressor-like RCC1 family protein